VHKLKTTLSQYTYRLYGLWLRSQWPLPYPEGTEAGLTEVELFKGSNLIFSEAARETMIQADAKAWFYHARLRNGSTYLRWSGLFEFVISAGGRRIACRSLNGGTKEAFHAYLVSQVLSFAMVRQGIEPLHATVVVVDGQAVAFLGDCGYGKSSLGAAFLQVGHPLLTDDVLVVEERDHGFAAYPGPPRIKLFPEVAKTFLGDCVGGTPMHPQTPKLVIPLDPFLSSQAVVPLKSIYVLRRPIPSSRGIKVTIRTLSQRRAFLELLRNTFNPVVMDGDRLKRQFKMATLVASKLPIKSLSYPRILALLPSVREAILSDLGRD
jgi:hypothetical protein